MNTPHGYSSSLTKPSSSSTPFRSFLTRDKGPSNQRTKKPVNNDGSSSGSTTAALYMRGGQFDPYYAQGPPSILASEGYRRPSAPAAVGPYRTQPGEYSNLTLVGSREPRRKHADRAERLLNNLDAKISGQDYSNMLYPVLSPTPSQQRPTTPPAVSRSSLEWSLSVNNPSNPGHWNQQIMNNRQAPMRQNSLPIPVAAAPSTAPNIGGLSPMQFARNDLHDTRRDSNLTMNGDEFRPQPSTKASKFFGLAGNEPPRQPVEQLGPSSKATKVLGFSVPGFSNSTQQQPLTGGYSHSQTIIYQNVPRPPRPPPAAKPNPIIDDHDDFNDNGQIVENHRNYEAGFRRDSTYSFIDMTSPNTSSASDASTPMGGNINLPPRRGAQYRESIMTVTSVQTTFSTDSGIPNFSKRRPESVIQSRPEAMKLKEFKEMMHNTDGGRPEQNLEEDESMFSLNTSHTKPQHLQISSQVQQGPSGLAPPPASSRTLKRNKDSAVNHPRGTEKPPTQNNMDPKERASQLRSKRKITQVLGHNPITGSHSTNGLDEEAKRISIVSAFNDGHSSKQKKKDPLGSPMSFMELSDEEGDRTPVRVRSPSPGSTPSDASGSLGLSLDLDAGNAIGQHLVDMGLDDDQTTPIISPVSLLPPSPQRRIPSRSPSPVTGRPQAPTPIQGTHHNYTNPSPISRTPPSYNKTLNHKPSFLTAMALELQTASTPAQQIKEMAEAKDREEKRKKRDKLAKMHRFLGSRVPSEMVIGVSSTDEYSERTLPSPMVATAVPSGVSKPTPSPRAFGSFAAIGNEYLDVEVDVKRRKRSSSDGAYRTWNSSMLHPADLAPTQAQTQTMSISALKNSRIVDDLEEAEMRKAGVLSDKERFAQVRKAQKLEQVLGEQPWNLFNGNGATTPNGTDRFRVPPRPAPKPPGFNTSAMRQLPNLFNKSHSPQLSSVDSTASHQPLLGFQQDNASVLDISPAAPLFGESEYYSNDAPYYNYNGMKAHQSPFASEPLFGTNELYNRPIKIEPESSSLVHTIKSSEKSEKSGPSDRSRRSAGRQKARHSKQYIHYRNSLKSLVQIVDSNDKDSLAELYAMLNAASPAGSDTEAELTKAAAVREHVEEAENYLDELHTFRKNNNRVSRNRLSTSTKASSLRRRNSFPARGSVASFGSYGSSGSGGHGSGVPSAGESSVISPSVLSRKSSIFTLKDHVPEPMSFQARRKRAAKLTNFFGTSYRDLFADVLERLENGMRDEAREGGMSQEEMDHLIHELDYLKSMRQDFN